MYTKYFLQHVLDLYLHHLAISQV